MVGDLSTRFTMGQTNFATLGEHVSAPGEAPFGHMGPDRHLWSEMVGSGPGVENWGKPLTSHGLGEIQSNNPMDATNAILKRMETLLQRIENSAMS